MIELGRQQIREADNGIERGTELMAERCKELLEGVGYFLRLLCLRFQFDVLGAEFVHESFPLHAAGKFISHEGKNLKVAINKLTCLYSQHFQNPLHFPLYYQGKNHKGFYLQLIQLGEALRSNGTTGNIFNDHGLTLVGSLGNNMRGFRYHALMNEVLGKFNVE
jgi:hypothetical protein